MIIIKIILWAIAILFVLFIFGWLNAIRASLSRNRKLDSKIQPAIQAIQANDSSAESIIVELANLPEIRNYLYKKLKEIGKENLFPIAFRSVEKAAESDLVCWLLHPNELNAVPSEIVFVRTVTVKDENKSGKVYLFKFRTKPPHWASNKGWMAGVAGPYWDEEELYTAATGTFSELISFDSMTEEEHVNCLREALHKRGLVVPS